MVLGHTSVATSSDQGTGDRRLLFMSLRVIPTLSSDVPGSPFTWSVGHGTWGPPPASLQGHSHHLASMKMIPACVSAFCMRNTVSALPWTSPGPGLDSSSPCYRAHTGTLGQFALIPIQKTSSWTNLFDVEHLTYSIFMRDFWSI